MHLVGEGGRSLDLSILGYEFPDHTGSRILFDDDANWLVIQGQASDGERGWTFRHACLLTTEAREIVSWLRSIADGRPPVDALDFTEPNLAFRLVSPSGAEPVVRVIFRLESRPPWVSNITEEDWDSASIDFDMLAEDLRAASNELDSELARYPKR